MTENKILNYLFDDETSKNIIDFCNAINEASADVYIVMARKAACFVQFLERSRYIDFGGKLVTDRLLDYDTGWLYGKKVVLIDDVIVSGTTIFTAIKKIELAGAESIQVIVVGVNKEYFNTELFDYETYTGERKNYITHPYLLLTDAGCIRMCSNIVAVFALNIAPYDVDFPQYNQIMLSKYNFEQIILNSEWTSYDVSSDLQSENNIKNITFLPTKEIMRKFDAAIGFSISNIGFFKIRILAKFNDNKNKPYTVNAVPYFLFNEITEKDVLSIYDKLLGKYTTNNSTVVKIRILQYIFAQKLFNIWAESVNRLLGKNLPWNIDYNAFLRIIPKYYWDSITFVSNAKEPLFKEKKEVQNIGPLHITDEVYSYVERKSNGVALQSKLVELFTNLYHTKEIKSRTIVKELGSKAFDMPEYNELINRLKHGYSYQDMIRLISGYSDTYDIETTVSLFIDEAIDAGVIVPIIAEEYSDTFGRFYFRAYRHGEDVPFGELQEKMCAVLLSNYADAGGDRALSKLRIEKLLVLFIRIGLIQKIFRPSPQDSIYYNVNIDAYLYGNIATIQDTTSSRRGHFIKYRSEVSWLTDILNEKKILLKDKNDKIIGVADPIDLPLDRSTLGKISAIGKIFAKLYLNSLDKKIPRLTDDDFVLFSTCTYPNDALNALAAELAIFSDRWKQKEGNLRNNLSTNPTKILELKANEIYYSINSGQDKFFDFMNQKGAKRISEIRDQLYEDPELNILGTIWDQFWPENIEWTQKTITPSLLYLILDEGYLLVSFNLLCRLLFLCVETDKTQSEIWKQQIVEYKNKLKSQWFSNKTFTEKLFQLCDSVDNALEQKSTFNIAMRICNTISYLNTYVASVLSDVELIIDRHGKTNQIIRYAHSLYIQLPENEYDNIREWLYEKLSSLNLQFQPFPIAEPDAYFPEAGIWVFLPRKCTIYQIKKLVSEIVIEHEKFKISECKVFYNLSDELRLKTISECGAKRSFGYFNSYSHEIVNIMHSSTQNFQRVKPITYWILENGKANDRMISKLGNILSSDFKVVNKSNIKLDVYRKISTTVFTVTPMSALDKFRREYKSMNPCTVFVSYSEENDEHLKKIQQVVERLKREGLTVYFYEEAPLGTDMIKFMRRIESCDIALIIGSSSYKQKAMEKPESGVSFEDGIFADIYQSKDREKIVPVVFGTFKDVIPVPFNKLKGMQFSSYPTNGEMDTFVAALINKHKNNLLKN